VFGVDLERFDLVEEAKRRHGVRYKNDLPWEAMQDVVESCKRILREQGSGMRLDEALSEPNRQLLTPVLALLNGSNAARSTR
jgi:hypothetical protein